MESVSICVICGQRWLRRDWVEGKARDVAPSWLFVIFVFQELRLRG